MIQVAHKVRPDGPSAEPPRARPPAEKNAAAFLEGRDLIEPQSAVVKLLSLPNARIEQLANDLSEFLAAQRAEWARGTPLELSPFNCVASSSIRGDSGCFNPSCRAAKLGFLSQYAAMYADQLFLPVPLPGPLETAPAEVTRDTLIQTVVSILEMRPLVERRIVRPITRDLHYCSECMREAMGRYREGQRAADALASKLRKHFAFSYELLDDDPETFAIRMRGPAEFIEHGQIIRVTPRIPRWAKINGKSGKGAALPRRSPVHLELVKDVLLRIGGDVLFHQQFAPKFRATYLTDLPGEAQFLSILGESDETAIGTARLFAALNHEIPFLRGLPIRTVLKIRDENPKSFELYRTALKGIVSEHLHAGHRATPKEARQIYEDTLSPAVAGLRVEADRQHARWVKKSATTVALAMAVVALGATGVLQSPQVLQLLGGAILKGLADQLGEAGTESARSDRLYFLLRLQEESIKRHKR